MPNSHHPALSSFFKKKISHKTIVKVIAIAVLVLALIGYLAWDILANGPLMQLLSNRDELVAAMNNLGPWAPFIFTMLQTLQVVVAPIPGQVVGGVGGFLFGYWGILWTTIGSIIGFWLVFLIARRFGRPLIEKIFNKSVVDKFDFIINAKSAPFILFAIFLLPGFPDDVVCYIAGLTKLSMRQLLAISIIGRIPTIVVTNFIGMGISDNIGLVVAVSIVIIIFIGLIVWKREQIIAFLKRNEERTLSKAKALRSKAKPPRILKPRQPKSESSDSDPAQSSSASSDSSGSSKPSQASE